MGAALTLVKDVDYIQDPTTGRLQGSHPHGGGDDKPAKPAAAPVPPAPKINSSGLVHDVHGMPKNSVIPSRELAVAVDRDAFTMTATERPQGKFEAGKRFEISIAAKKTEGVEEFFARASDKQPNLYDPRLAALVTEDKGESYERQRAVPRDQAKKNIEALDRTDIIYRGMSAEEFEGARKNGYFESRGDYNLGAEQEGKTFWSTEVATAEAYANGFAPWQYGATFEKPGYVVAVVKPESGEIIPRYPTEVAVPGQVPTSEIVAFWKGDVYEHRPGEREAIQTTEDEYRLGGGVGPRSSVVWTKTTTGTKGFDPSQPRDEHGRWVGDGGGEDSAPKPFEPESDKLLLVSERPSDEKLLIWEKQIKDRKEELDRQGAGTPQESAAGGKEWAELNKMDAALLQYKRTSEADREADRYGLQTVYDGDLKLLAAVGTKYDPEVGVAKVLAAGGTDKAAKVKALEQVIRRYGEKAERIEARVWSDDLDEIALFEEAGFQKSGEPTSQGGLQTLVYGEKGQTKAEKAKEQQATREHSEKILGASQAAAQLLGYDPRLVEVSDDEHNFTIGDETMSRQAAGVAHLETGRITMYPKAIRNAEGAVSVMAHEVAHQKYDAVLKALLAETAAVFADPGAPPDPNHPHRWGQIGGKEVVTAPDGSLRPPYDKKYPLYERFHKHNENLDKRIKSDGITEYSKAYWEQAKPGAKNQVSLYLAQHETIAEMARKLTDTRKLEGAPEWKAYYKDIDKTWNELLEAKRTA